MRNFYLKRKENLKKLKKKEDNIKNQINISINSIQKINVNKYPINYKIIKEKENDNKILTEKKRNYKSYFIDKDKENTRKNRVELKQKQNDSELSILIGKINKEFYKNKRNYNTSISDCLNIDSHNSHNKNYSHKDYINLKALNNINNNNNSNNYKLYGSYTKDNSRDYSFNSFNRPASYMKYQRKNSINTHINNNLIYKSFQIFPRNHSYASIQTKPQFPDYRHAHRNNYKNRISNYILKNQYRQGYLSTDYKNENDNENNAKFIQVNKSLGSNYIKTLNKIRNDSLSKGKRKISPVCDNILESKGKEIFGNSKNINNIDNYYNFWNDNDGHSGGKINLALNNPCRNKVDFLSSLYHIVKIQSMWRGYYLRKSLLTKNNKNPKLNIFYKQKYFITKLFKFVNHHNLKQNFEIFKEKIKDIEKNGYEVNSSLINNISNCYRQIYKRNNNLLLYNKKRLSQSRKNSKLLNNNNLQLDMYTPKIKKQKTKLDGNFYGRNKRSTNNYKALKTNDIYYQGNDENKISNTKSNKKFLGILPDDKNTSHFSINNIININKRKTILSNIVKNREKIRGEENKNYISNNVKNNNNINNYDNDSNAINYDNHNNVNRYNNNVNNYDNNVNNYENNSNNYDNNGNNNTNKNKESNNNINKNNKNNVKSINYNKNNNKSNKLKYKEYIYFLFLLFARIQKASHNLFFKELLDKLNEIKNINLQKDKINKLLKIIKQNEKKTIKHYYRIFKEKVLTEKIKDIILNKNSYESIGKKINDNKYFQIKNNYNIFNKKNNNMIINHKDIKNKFLSHSHNFNINSKNNNDNEKDNDMNNINNKDVDSKSHDLARQFSKKRYIKIKKMNRAVSVNPELAQSASNNKYNNSFLALSKSTCYTPRKKMVIKYKSGISTPINNDEYYQYTPGFIMRKKVCAIIRKFDKKQLNLFFKRWKVRTNCAKKKKFLIYFIMLMKEYFCNDKSIKYKKEYEMGKYMFFWYRKTFH